MSDDENDGKRTMPSRYAVDGKDARWRRLWLQKRGGHADDDGADPCGEVDGKLPPLPDNVRDEGKYIGRRPSSLSDDGQQLRRP